MPGDSPVALNLLQSQLLFLGQHTVTLRETSKGLTVSSQILETLPWSH